jgi:TolB-like protein/Flp pilus assembly protein TadD
LDLIFLVLSVIGVVVAIVFGFLQVIIPFVKGEVRFSEKYPFVINVERAGLLPAGSKKRRKLKKSVVVLPLKNLGKAEDDYFTVGVAEEITNRLAAVSGLKVISRTSANLYSNTNRTICEIGEELGVEYALEGTVRWARTQGGADRVRVTSQLVRVADDTHLWADTYDRVLDDIFDIQSDIAQKVVTQLGTKILEQERATMANKPTDNMEAYHAYLQARYYATRPHFSLDNWQRVIGCSERAVELDPAFVLAYVELVKAHAKFYFFWFDHTDERRTLAERAVKRATELAPDSPQVHLAEGLFHLWVHRDTKKALEEITHAERILPNSVDVIEAKASVLEVVGDWDEAIRTYKRAFILSPREASLPMAMAYSFWVSRRYAEAIEACESSIQLAPDDAWPYVTKAFIHWSWQGNNKGARAALESIRVKYGWKPWMWYWVEMYDRRYAEAIKRLEGLEGEWVRIKICAQPKALLTAHAHYSMGEQDRASAEYDLAKSMLEEEVKKHPDDPRYHSSLGITFAALGMKSRAIKEGKKATSLLPVSMDAFYGIPYVVDLAQIYTLIGEYDAALERLEYLLTIPSWISVAYIRIDPRWDKLRNHPKFEKLLERSQKPV